MENVGSGMPSDSRGTYVLACREPLARLGLAWRTAAPIPCAGPTATPGGEHAGAIWRFRDRGTGGNENEPRPDAAGNSAAAGRAPARIADATRARELALAFDLRRLPADYYANPYPTYHALREHAPVHRMPDGGYFLSRYADCVAVYKDTAAFSSDKKREFAPKYGDGLLYEHHTTSLVFNDPPLHTRVRRIIAGALHAARHRRHGARRWWRWSTACSTPWPPRAAPT